METERKIEKLLRAFSKKRKKDAGAPLDLHPATRRLLQDEVARNAEKPAGEGISFWQFLFMTPRRAFAFGVFASLVVSVTLIWLSSGGSKSKNMLADNKRVSEEKVSASKPAESVGGLAATAPASPTISRADTAPAATPVAATATAVVDAPTIATAPAPVAPAVAAPVAVAESRTTRSVTFDDASGAANRLNKTASNDGVAPPPVNAPLVASDQTGSRPSAAGGFGGGGGGGGFGGAVGGRGGGGGGRGGRGGARGGSAPPALTAQSVASNQASKDSAIAPASEVAVSRNRDGDLLTANNSAQFSNADKVRLEQPKDGVVSQNFYRLDLNGQSGSAGDKQTPATVLNTFAFEQDGNEITVVDQDGSKYSGFIRVASATDENTATTADRLQAKAPATTVRREVQAATPASAFAVASQSTLNTANYFFSVSGTNRSLNQPVVFSGNLAIATNAVVTNAIGNDAYLRVLQQATPAVQLMNSRITGQATLDGKSEIQINAAPVKP